MTFEDYGEGIGSAATVLRANATATGLEAPVPTCPGWTVGDLVLHQAIVHRWTTDTLLGVPDRRREHETAGRAAHDLLTWADDAATAMLDALSKAEQDLDVYFFLRNAPRPREAWARRQCHETTIHAVDAMTVRLGRPPRSRETWFGATLAADGIDELIRGMVEGHKTALRSPVPMRLAVVADDTGDAWTLEVTDGPALTSRGVADLDGVDATLSGQAVGLYLALWNRGDEVRCDGADVLPLWRSTVAI